MVSISINTDMWEDNEAVKMFYLKTIQFMFYGGVACLIAYVFFQITILSIVYVIIGSIIMGLPYMSYLKWKKEKR